jgi:hypothetical protein
MLLITHYVLRITFLKNHLPQAAKRGIVVSKVITRIGHYVGNLSTEGGSGMRCLIIIDMLVLVHCVSICAASAQVTFTDVTQEAGIVAQGLNSLAVTWGDYDNDGDLDLYVGRGRWDPAAAVEGSDIFYRNNGDGTFTDATDEAGLGGNMGWASYAGFMDYDNDGYPDLYTDKMYASKHVLYHNNGDGTFLDVTREIGMEIPGTWAGGDTFGDYDNDGDLDIYFITDRMSNVFYENNGDGTFTDATDRSGLGNTLAGLDVTSGDYDNDGHLDIYLANADLDNDQVANEPQPTALYRNNGDGTFTDVAQEAGVLVGSSQRLTVGGKRKQVRNVMEVVE